MKIELIRNDGWLEGKYFSERFQCELDVSAEINENISEEYVQRCVDAVEGFSDAMLDEICEAAKRYCLAFIRVEKDAQGDEYQVSEPYQSVTKDTPARELLHLVSFHSLVIDEIENEDLLYFRLSGGCDWEIEYGIEADFLDNQLFYLGSFEHVEADDDYYSSGKGMQWNYALTDEQITAPILAALGEIADLGSSGGVSDAEIDEAERTLQLLFPKEYRAILRRYGSIDFFAHEWTGLGFDGYLNVVNMTQRERELNEALAEKLFVLEDAGIDGIIIVANEMGDVFQVQFDSCKQIHDSILAYLQWCLRDK